MSFTASRRKEKAMVQRYEARKDYFGNVILPPKNDEGKLVLYSDYATLRKRLEPTIRDADERN